MRFISSSLICLLLCSSLWAQTTSSSTGKSKINEEDYNSQLEKCKVDSNATPAAQTVKGNTTKTGTSNVRSQ